MLPDLNELGVDTINPVQVSANDMDNAKLKKEFGVELTLFGGIDTQKGMPMGSPEDVEKEVIRSIKGLAPGGGYVLMPVHNIQADVRSENVCRMFEAAKEFGTYPLKLSGVLN